MELPLKIIIPNLGPPTFRLATIDISLKIGMDWQYKFSSMIDPDMEDSSSLKQIDFGKADEFITGKFPRYKISPRDNITHPGIYMVRVTLIDDNPAPMTMTYMFKIIVIPLPPLPEVPIVTVPVKQGQK